MTRVLLIDDDTELTSLLSEYLAEEGFTVETSDDARLGIADAAGSTADIIILDVMMPRMNGIDALQRIRRLSNVPVIMLTAKDSEVDKVLGLFPSHAKYYFAKADIPRGLDAEVLREKAAAFGMKGKAYRSVRRALSAAKRSARQEDLILVIGSIFVAAEVL